MIKPITLNSYLFGSSSVSSASSIQSFAPVDEADKSSKQQAQQAQKQQGQQIPPWFNLMAQLGLEPTGSKEGDLAAITQKISQMEAQATSEEQKAEIASLNALVTSLFGTSVSGGVSASEKTAEGSAQTNINTPSYTGQNQLAQMNKFFMLNK